MNTYKVNITGTYHVQVNIDATSSREAEEKAAELDVTAIEHELFWNHGLSKRDILSIAADATPVDTGRYIVQPKGELYYLCFESRPALVRHLREAANNMGWSGLDTHELYEFFRTRNYFRVL